MRKRLKKKRNKREVARIVEQLRPRPKYTFIDMGVGPDLTAYTYYVHYMRRSQDELSKRHMVRSELIGAGNG